MAENYRFTFADCTIVRSTKPPDPGWEYAWTVYRSGVTEGIFQTEGEALSFAKALDVRA